jgi:hypothetical protein
VHVCWNHSKSSIYFDLKYPTAMSSISSSLLHLLFKNASCSLFLQLKRLPRLRILFTLATNIDGFGYLGAALLSFPSAVGLLYYPNAQLSAVDYLLSGQMSPLPLTLRRRLTNIGYSNIRLTVCRILVETGRN